jgi:hypothetical protein
MTIRLPAVLALLVALAGCNPLRDAEQESLRRWLLCDECTEGELYAVLALGERPLGSLRKFLRDGPPDDRRRNIRLQAEGMYDRAEPGGIEREAYIAGIVQNYVATYQKRAALALDTIGTPRARGILIEALQRDPGYREDVRRVLGQAIGVLVTAVAGDSQHAPLDSTLKDDPTVLVSDSITGQAIQGVRVVFRADSGEVSDSVRFTDADGEAAVSWTLGSSPGVNVLLVRAAGKSLRLTAIAHAPGLHLDFEVQPSDGLSGQPIAPTVRIVVRDQWGVTQTNLDDPDGVLVSMVGTTFSSVHPIIDGVADLSGLSYPVLGTGLRLAAERAGLVPVLSDSFDLAP